MGLASIDGVMVMLIVSVVTEIKLMELKTRRRNTIRIIPMIIHHTVILTALGLGIRARLWGARWYRATPRTRPATKLIASCMRVWVR